MLTKPHHRCISIILLGFFLGLTSLLANANNEIKCIVETNNGLHSFDVTPEFSIKINNSSIDLILNSNILLNVPQDDFLSIYYAQEENASVSNINNEKKNYISITDNILYIICHFDNQIFELFDINGNMMLSRPISPDIKHSFDLSGFEAGFYIIRINNNSYKIHIHK